MEEREYFKCDSFIFYSSFYEGIKELPLEQQAIVYDAVFRYAFTGVEADLKGLAKGIFSLIKPQLKANRVKYENGCKGAEFGGRGGAPKGNKNAQKQPRNNPETTPTEKQPTKQKQPRNNPETTPNYNYNYNDICSANAYYKEIKERLKKEEGAYFGYQFSFEMHPVETEQIIRALLTGVEQDEQLTINGKLWTGDDWQNCLDTINCTRIGGVIERIIKKDETVINNQLRYVLGLIAYRWYE